MQGSNNQSFDFGVPVPNINFSISETESRLLGLLDLIDGLKLEKDYLLVPQNYFVNLENSLSKLEDQITTIQNSLDEVKKHGGPGALDKDNFTLQSHNGKYNLDLKGFVQNINNNIDGVLDLYYRLAFILDGPRFNDFSEAFNQFSDKLKDLQRKLKELEVLEGRGEEISRQFQDNQEKASLLVSGIGSLKEESEKSRKTIAEYEAEVTQKRANILEIASQAEKLKNNVQSYQSQFDNFQNQLDTREKHFKEGKANLDQLLKMGKEEQERLTESLREIEGEIKRLNDQAEDMLQGATVAGLASSFGEIRDQLTNELRNARWTFYFAIFILFVSAVPLVIYVIPGFNLFSWGGGEASKGGFGEILVRALLLLPGAWFTKFAASRHASLFRLKEHYAYKYSVASSVEGFKKQAEPFKDAIAAATFFELTFNPANQMETKGHEERHPNVVMEWIMKKLGTTHDGNPS